VIKVDKKYWLKDIDESGMETEAYLDFLKQIIACHARHTVICYNKIHLHFL